MAVDRGGLKYPIEVPDLFSKNLLGFVKGLRTTIAEINRAAAAASKLKGVASSISSAASAATRSAAASTAAAAKRSKALNVDAEAAKRYAKRLREIAVEERVANLDRTASFRLAAKQQTADEKLAAAERRLAKVIDDRAKATSNAAAVARNNIRLLDEERKKLGLLTLEEQRLLASRTRLSALKTDTSSDRIKDLGVETEALRRVARAEREAAVAARLRAQGLDIRGRAIVAPAVPIIPPPPQDTVNRWTRFTTGLRDSLLQSSDSANQASFTFRRLFGILAAFTAARLAIRGFRSLVSELVRYNANIEQATLGVASLFLAVGNVRDATGQATTAARGLVLAQKEASRQIALLRRDSLQTAATFEQLLETFQVAVAPGLQAGLNVDEIRDFTVQISRAASAIGLLQNQLSEEIRSILQGTIQQRTTRIAVALGITNEDIRNAKEAGVLMDFLNQRFAAFRVAGEESLKTFNALWTNLQEAIQRVLESGGNEFFDELKGTLGELFDLLINQDPISGLLTPDPKAVSVVRAFSDALVSALRTAKDISKNLTVEDFVGAARTASTAIAAAARVVSNLVAGFIRGLRDVGRSAEAIASIFGKSLFDNEAISQTTQWIGRILAYMLAVVAAAGAFKLLIGTVSVIFGSLYSGTVLLVKAWKALQVTVLAVRSAMLLMNPLALAIAAAVGISVAALVAGYLILKDWLKEATGIEFKFTSILKLVKGTLIYSLRLAVINISNLILTTYGNIKGFVLKASRFVIDSLLGIVVKVLDSASFLSDTAKDAAAAVSQIRREFNDSLDKSISGTARNMERAGEVYRKQKEELDRAFRSDLFSATFNQASEKDFTEVVRDLMQRGMELALGEGYLSRLFGTAELPDIGSSLTEPLQDAKEEALLLSAEFEKLPGIVGTVAEGLAGNSDLLKRLRDDAFDAAEEFRAGSDSLKISGSALNLRRKLLEAEKDIRKETQFLDVQQRQLDAQRISALERVEDLSARIARLSSAQQAAVASSEAGLRALAGLQREEAEAVNRIAITRLTLNKSLLDGNSEAAGLASQELRIQEQALDAVKGRVAALKESLDLALANSGLDVQQQNQVIRLTLDRVLASGQLSAVEEQIRNTVADRLEVERSVNRVLSDRLSIAAREAALNAERERSELSLDLIRTNAELLSDRQANNAQKRLTLANAELQVISEQISLSAEQRRLESEDLDRLLASRREYLASLEESRAKVLAGSAEEVALLERIAAAQREINDLGLAREQIALRDAAAAALEANQMEAVRRAAEQARLELEQPVSLGLTKAFEEFRDDALDLFTQVKDISRRSLEDISSIISSSIVDAFDPGSDETIQERLRRFLLDFAKQVIDTLVRIAIVKAVLNLGFLGEGGAVSGGLGFAKGGLIEVPHSKAKGFARGGQPSLGAGADGRVVTGSRLGGISRMIDSIRPAGLDPRDRIPIWARKGEFVLVPEAVRKMGSDIAYALNELQFDPTLLRMAVGLSSRTKAQSKVGKVGFAAGGVVSSPSQIPSSAQISSIPSESPTRAFVVVGEVEAQRMLSGGRRAFIDFFRANRDQILAGYKG